MTQPHCCVKFSNKICLNLTSYGALFNCTTVGQASQILLGTLWLNFNFSLAVVIRFLCFIILCYLIRLFHCNDTLHKLGIFHGRVNMFYALKIT